MIKMFNLIVLTAVGLSAYFYKIKEINSLLIILFMVMIIIYFNKFKIEGLDNISNGSLQTISSMINNGKITTQNLHVTRNAIIDGNMDIKGNMNVSETWKMKKDNNISILESQNR